MHPFRQQGRKRVWKVAPAKVAVPESVTKQDSCGRQITLPVRLQRLLAKCIGNQSCAALDPDVIAHGGMARQKFFLDVQLIQGCACAIGGRLRCAVVAIKCQDFRNPHYRRVDGDVQP